MTQFPTFPAPPLTITPSIHHNPPFFSTPISQSGPSLSSVHAAYTDPSAHAAYSAAFLPPAASLAPVPPPLPFNGAALLSTSFSDHAGSTGVAASAPLSSSTPATTAPVPSAAGPSRTSRGGPENRHSPLPSAAKKKSKKSRKHPDQLTRDSKAAIADVRGTDVSIFYLSIAA